MIKEFVVLLTILSESDKTKFQIETSNYLYQTNNSNSGNTNNYLKSLSVDGKYLTPTFDKDILTCLYSSVNYVYNGIKRD